MPTHREELREYLRSRRARLQPSDVGLQDFGDPRRVPGLRREEIALLAGVSVDYYTRLEQGRTRNVSGAVLDAVARALQLDDVERAHLRDLARPTPARRQRKARPQRVRPAVRALMEGLDKQPAFVMGYRLDVLASNALLDALMPGLVDDPGNENNIARFIFLDDSSRDLHRDWDQVAEETAAMLRFHAGRHPDDPDLSRLVGDLSMRSREFARMWSAHDVRSRSFGTKTYHHPLVGEMHLNYEALSFPDDADMRLCIYSADPSSMSEQSLLLLSSTLTTAPEPDRSRIAGGTTS